MQKTVIHIFGASGSGTSTLGKALSEALDFKWMDTDDYFWVPTNPKFTTKRPKEERLVLIQADIDASQGAVLSGALTEWGDPLVPLFTLAIRVNTATPVRIERIRAREAMRFGERVMPGGDMYEQHQAFLKWAASYDEGGLNMRSRAAHDKWEKTLTCPLLTLDGALPVEENLRRVLDVLGR